MWGTHCVSALLTLATFGNAQLVRLSAPLSHTQDWETQDTPTEGAYREYSSVEGRKGKLVWISCHINTTCHVWALTEKISTRSLPLTASPSQYTCPHPSVQIHSSSSTFSWFWLVAFLLSLLCAYKTLVIPLSQQGSYFSCNYSQGCLALSSVLILPKEAIRFLRTGSTQLFLHPQHLARCPVEGKYSAKICWVNY